MIESGMRDIKRRMKSIESTMKVTKAMELVASSKLRKSKQKMEEVKPFFQKLYDVMIDISKDTNGIESMFISPRIVKKRCYIVIAGDRGLAGGYNGNVFRYVQENIQHYNKNDVWIIPIGKKSMEFFERRDYNIYIKYYNISENLTMRNALDISNKIIDGFLKNDFQEISIVFTNFVSVLVQRPDMKKLLPLCFSNVKKSRGNYITVYDPSPESVFNVIVPQYLSGMIYGAIVESFAAEQGARRMAMESASKNANEMINDMNMVYNRVRQTMITQEITEIVSAAQALK